MAIIEGPGGWFCNLHGGEECQCTPEDLVPEILRLRAELADAIPRATLVSALRELAVEAESAFGGSSNSAQFQADCYRCLADEIERGEWPNGEGK